MVQILSMIPIDGLDAVDAACAEALSEGVPAASVVINILARHREPPPPLAIDTPAASRWKRACGTTRLACEPVADCKRYDSLRRPDHGKITGAGRVTPKACLRHTDKARVPRDAPAEALRHEGRLTHEIITSCRRHAFSMTAVRRQHEPQQIVGDLLNAEISEVRHVPPPVRGHAERRARSNTR
jgi:hypothetical protein